MSNAYYQGYGTQYPTYPAASDQQNVGYMQQITGTGPSYGLNPGYPPAPRSNEEYMRQPAMSPYPSAPVVAMPQPTIMQQPAAEPEPRVIIVHHNNRDSDESSCDEVCCGCCAYLLARLCYTLIFFCLGVVAIGLAVYFIKYYRNHH